MRAKQDRKPQIRCVLAAQVLVELSELAHKADRDHETVDEIDVMQRDVENQGIPRN